MHPASRPVARDHPPVVIRLHALAITRLIAAIALLAVGAVHLQQYRAGYSVVPTIGPLFLLNFIGGTVLGVYFLVPAGTKPGHLRRLIDAVAALVGWGVAAGAFVALLVSEHTPLFGFMEHGYRFAIVFALTSEAVAVVALAALLLLRRSIGGQRPGSRRLDPVITTTAASTPTGAW